MPTARKCTVHGGQFTPPSKPGRPPQKCHPDYPCDRMRPPLKVKDIETLKDPSGRVVGLQAPSRVERTASAMKNRRMAKHSSYAEQLACDHPNARPIHARCPDCGVRLEQRSGIEPISLNYGKRRKPRGQASVAFNDGTQQVTSSAVPSTPVVVPVEKPVEARTVANPSIPKAEEAKRRLEPLGWSVTALARGTSAQLTGARGDELITLCWVDGVLTDQKYSLWNQNMPKANNKPASKLGFDPDEIPDKELVQRLTGMRVTWWNALGQKEESGIIPADRTVDDEKGKPLFRAAKVTVQHIYTGDGDETPADRIISFHDLDGNGFRAFRLGALLKIG